MSGVGGLARRINLLDADRMHRQVRKWVPQPHQVPPDGEWRGWALLAGRGSGKTDACAAYVQQHVTGPPCLPGPVPHWIGIIAPTLGDAATSCFYGPSGIRVHSPGAKLINGIGGAVVRWPNGSEAKLFGAHTPEDVERLRSGGNRCAAEGTPVRTEHGNRPIEDIRPGDRVWTRNGLRRVLAVWDNGIKEVRLYRHAAGGTWLTHDHRVWTDHGWKQASSVQTTDTVFTWLSTSSTTESGGTPASVIPTIGTAGADSCTGGCTCRRSDRSRQGCMCITKITTSGTTGSVTSCCFVPESTGRSTQTNAEATGTARVAKPRGSVLSTGRSCATGAERTSGHEEPREPSTAHRLAVMPPLRHAHGKNGCAACAEAPSSARPDTRPVPVHGDVLRSTPMRRVARVYDLTVEHDHEFFAGDLLVSNCLSWLEELAAWRYLDAAWAHMRFGLRVGPRPHWIASTTPKPKMLIKRLSNGEMRGVVISRASMYDNPHLQDDIKEALEEEYGGTQLGRQELYAEVLDQDENALWTHDLIDASRVLRDATPDMVRRSVGVDPSGGAGEQGIVVVGKAMIEREHEDARKRVKLPHGYVLADRTVQLSPDGWGRRAVQAAVDWEADDICVEINYGGDMAVSTIRSAAEHMGISIPIRTVRATRGKRVRAEPVAALTEQNRWHLVGNHPELENQMTTWYPELDWSPDRLDAMVWPGWHQRIVKLTMTGSATPGGMASVNKKIA